MALTITPIPALTDNYIWLLTDYAKQTAYVVDPGDAKPVIEQLANQQLSLQGILLTHHHGDHTHGVPDLLAYAGAVPVIASHYSTLPYINQPVRQSDAISLLDYSFQAIEIPGHTLDHTAYYCTALNIVFTGDTLFSAGCGRVFEGTAEMMLNSLHTLMQLPDETQVFCGHEYTFNNLRFAALVEPDNRAIQQRLVWIKQLTSDHACTLPSTLAIEKSINPFLRCHDITVKQSTENHAGHRLNTETEIFASLRAWKNTWSS